MMLVAENRHYDYLFQEPISQPKRKVRTKAQPKKRIKNKQKVKYVSFILFGLLIALTILYQYAKLNIINQEILSLEQEINNVYMVNDSVEGDLIASEDLSRIERIAKDKLGMIEPVADQMTIIEVEVINNQEEATTMVDKTKPTEFFGTLSKILDFID